MARARGVHSPAAARPRGRRARRSPGGPERSSAPAPRRPGQAAPPRRRAAARAGRAASSSRAARGGGPLSRGARLPSPASAPWAAAEPRDGGKGLSRRTGGRERGLRHPSRSVPAAATTTRAVLLLPTCRGDTEHARAETTSGLCDGHAKDSGDAGGIRDTDAASREVLKTPSHTMAHHRGGMKPQMGQAHLCVLASKGDEPRTYILKDLLC
nr:transcription initiation factor TFIID subunit 4-like [Equus asinus]